MRGLSFQDLNSPPRGRSEANRQDVACFVGLVARRNAPVPRELRRWLRTRGFVGGNDDPRLESLEHVPVPIESWPHFEALFAHDERRLARPKTGPAPRPQDAAPELPRASGEKPYGDTFLGAAVRSFFAQGGRRCFVVRAGNPLPSDAEIGKRRAILHEHLIPRAEGDCEAAGARGKWRGFGVLHGLPSVSFLALPDLPDLLGERGAPPPSAPLPPRAVGFEECSEDVRLVRDEWSASQIDAARVVDERRLRDWAAEVHTAASFLARHRRDVQLVVSLPLAAPEFSLQQDPRRAHLVLDLLESFDHLRAASGSEPARRVSAFVQVAYPWLRWQGSERLPAGLEPADGALIGMLARTALVGGSFRTSAGALLDNVTELFPRLSRAQREGETFDGDKCFEDRFSLLGETEVGIQLLSDVTASSHSAYRPAQLNRLVSIWLRAARLAGEEAVFEPSGERLWARVRERLEGVGARLLSLGALRGPRDRDAYQVRCDRSTMTQNDIDNGRVIASVSFVPAHAIEHIRVALALDAGAAPARLRGAA